MELEKCPFCGHKGPLITVKSRYRKGIANRLMYWVYCGYCDASQRHDDLSGHRTREKAIKAWNRLSAKT